jgi:hypothetical protein
MELNLAMDVLPALKQILQRYISEDVKFFVLEEGVTQIFENVVRIFQIQVTNIDAIVNFTVNAVGRCRYISLSLHCEGCLTFLIGGLNVAELTPCYH